MRSTRRENTQGRGWSRVRQDVEVAKGQKQTQWVWGILRRWNMTLMYQLSTDWRLRPTTTSLSDIRAYNRLAMQRHRIQLLHHSAGWQRGGGRTKPHHGHNPIRKLFAAKLPEKTLQNRRVTLQSCDFIAYFAADCVEYERTLCGGGLCPVGFTVYSTEAKEVAVVLDARRRIL